MMNMTDRTAKVFPQRLLTSFLLLPRLSSAVTPSIIIVGFTRASALDALDVGGCPFPCLFQAFQKEGWFEVILSYVAS